MKKLFIMAVIAIVFFVSNPTYAMDIAKPYIDVDAMTGNNQSFDVPKHKARGYNRIHEGGPKVKFGGHIFNVPAPKVRPVHFLDNNNDICYHLKKNGSKFLLEKCVADNIRTMIKQYSTRHEPRIMYEGDIILYYCWLGNRFQNSKKHQIFVKCK